MPLKPFWRRAARKAKTHTRFGQPWLGSGLTLLPLATGAQARAWAVRMFRDHRRDFVTVVTLVSLATVAGLVGPQILGMLVDAVTGAGAGSIDVLALVFVVVLVAQAVLRRLAQVRVGMLGERVLADTRENFVEQSLRLPLGTVEAAGTGDLLSRATTDVGRIDFAVRRGVPQITVALITVVLTVVAMVVTSPFLSLGLLVGVAVIGVTVRWFAHRVPSIVEPMMASWSDVHTSMHETADGARTAEALGLVGRRIAHGNRAVDDALGWEYRLRRLTVTWIPAARIAQVLPLAVILLLGAWGYSRDLVGLGTIATMMVYTQTLAGPLEEAMWWIEDVQVAITALRRVLGVGVVPAQRIDSSSEKPRGREIVVRDVRYGYTADREVLHGINLRVPPGQRLAIVGPSGAGKSTLGRLLAGVAAPQAGSVTVGGVEVSRLAEDVLRSEVLLLTQEQHVFAGTLRENLMLPAGDWSDEELVAALNAVGLPNWFAELPDGLDTRLGTGALAVPAATAQQLALARVVLADPHTVVLDEATSLLDTSSARNLERSLSRVLAGRTVIAIAHRLHTAAAADRVAVVEDGRITEIGPHAELVAAGGSYARLVAAAEGGGQAAVSASRAE